MRKAKRILEKLKKIEKVRESMELEVKDIMTPEVITISPDSTLIEAAEQMLENRIHALVVTENDKPIGIITTYDLVLVIALSDFDKLTKVRDVMVTKLITVSPNEKVKDAIKKVIEKNIRRLIVVDGDKLVGIVSLIDLLLAYVTLPSSFTNQS